MRHLIFLITFLVAVWLVSSNPIDPKRWLVNRPTVPSRRYDFDENLLRYKRLASRNGGVKGGGTRSGLTIEELEKNLTKGEYICGNRICKLKPGQIPKGCPEGMCQYPIGFSTN